MMTSPDYNATIADTLRRYQIACDELTESQLAEALRQALACGDFKRFVRAGGPPSQTVVYIPFEREQEHKAEIARLREEVAQLGRGARLEYSGSKNDPGGLGFTGL